jgi:2,3,4,5-tetrahydropyridine-2,6-dicarboxylate N-succinyltransferase
MKSLYALGIGIGTKNKKGEWLEVFYPAPLLNVSEEISAAVIEHIGSGTNVLHTAKLDSLAAGLKAAGADEQAAIVASFEHTEGVPVVCALESDESPTDVPSGYLKLHLLSHRLVKPHGTNLGGLFGVLANVAWTNEGAIAIDELSERKLLARNQGRQLIVNSIDKFPRMTDYVVPGGVRIGDASRVRLGAYLGEGTTVMHEGFVNFNAGTEGPNMIEGRISAGVFVGAGSDLGGGSSTMGTLSGGGNIVISIGKECLIGANGGVGIPLGDRCTVESGLYITAGTKVQMIDDAGTIATKVKAFDLKGKSGLLFRRNSLTGAVECLTNKSAVELNDELHAHN